jgi:PAS domain S-box-containing protein
MRDEIRNPRTLAYAAIVLSAAAMLAMSNIHSAQRRAIASDDAVLSSLRLARIDLNRGFLRTQSSGAASSDRDEGLAMLRQAEQTLAEASRAYADSGVRSPENLSSFAEIDGAFASFMSRLETDGAEGERYAELRISFYAIERKAELLDSAIQEELREFLRGLDAQYVAALWLASFILIGVTAAIHASARAKARISASLRESQELMRSIIENTPSFVYAFDTEGRCVLANRRVADFMRVDAEWMIGRRRAEWMAEETEKAHRLNDGQVLEGNEPITIEEDITEGDGRRVFLTTKFPLLGPDGRVWAVGGISTDITERKRSEQELREALAEREVLLRELNHRTKNNMQVISSWLALQSSRSDDPAVVAVLREADARIKAMALVHRKLYQGGNLSSIDLADYLRELLGVLVAAYGDEDLRVSTALDLQELRAVIDVAVPCGLIVSELVSNSLKHAFKDGREGTIALTLKRNAADEIELAYSDDGPGCPGGLPGPGSKGIGLATVKAIGENQLGGRVRFETDRGFSFGLAFSDAGFRARV